MKGIIEAIKNQIFEVKVRIEIIECNIECCEEDNEEKWAFEFQKNEIERNVLSPLRQALFSLYSLNGVEVSKSCPEGVKSYRELFPKLK